MECICGPNHNSSEEDPGGDDETVIEKTMEKVSALRQENELLEEKTKLLSRELNFLKDISMAHNSSTQGLNDDDVEIRNLSKKMMMMSHTP